MNVTLSINAGDEITINPQDGQGGALDFDSVHVGMDGETRCNAGDEAAPEKRCANCGTGRTEDNETEACTDAQECPDCDGYGASDRGMGDECPACEGGGTDRHAWEFVPGGFANSAGVSVSDSDDSVTVTISVGDPRGAFAMTVRRMEDGTLLLHVPYAGMSWSHAKLTELHPGTFRIGD